MLRPQFTTKPLYVQLREALASRIATGEWKPGHAIPNEIELADFYNLSVGTVRKALDWMESTRLVMRKQGRGTFVREATEADFALRFSRIRDSNGKPVIGTLLPVEVGHGLASREERDRLSLSPTAAVRRTRSIQIVDSVYVCTSVSVVPASLFELHRDQCLSVFSMAKACGVILLKGEERVEPDIADKEIAHAFQCDIGTAVLRFDRLLVAIDGTPAAWERGVWHLPGGYYHFWLGDFGQFDAAPSTTLEASDV